MKTKLFSSLLFSSLLIVMAGCSSEEMSNEKEKTKSNIEESIASEISKSKDSNDMKLDVYKVKQNEILFDNELILLDEGVGSTIHVIPLNYYTTKGFVNKKGEIYEAKDGNVFLITEHSIQNKGKSPLSMTTYMTSPKQIKFDSDYSYLESNLIFDYETMVGLEKTETPFDLNPLDTFLKRNVFEVNESLLNESFTLQIIDKNPFKGETVIDFIRFEKE